MLRGIPVPTLQLPMRLLPLLLSGLLLLPACAQTRVSSAPAAGDLAGEESVKPGINDSWKGDDINPLVGRLESESREIFTRRRLLGAVVGPPVGASIADVGAGSGFMTHLFSRLVGPEGRVYAVDINESLLGHIADGARERGLDNIETVLGTEKSVELPEASVDVVFICDTYHHFEYPRNSMASIHRALRPGGQLLLVDFERIPGVSRDWLLDHVRAGKEVFRAEIEAAGFRLVAEHDLEELEENYCLRFERI